MMNAGKKKAPMPTSANAVRAIQSERMRDRDIVIGEAEPHDSTGWNSNQFKVYSRIVGKYYAEWATPGHTDET